MDIDQAILTRRTITRFLPKIVEPEKLDEILSAGLWAQNHRLTQPWRFVILGAETHQKLSSLFGRLQANFLPPEAGDAERSAVVEAARRKLMARPKIVVASSLLRGDAQQRKEDYAATACAIQNIQLSAWAKGVGMQWSTGPGTRNPATYELLGCDPLAEEIVGFLFFGYPAEIPPVPNRKPLAEVRRFLE
jgi:nitroreductase